MDKKNRILLVDDEQDILEFISYNLEKEGYEIATASNGFDAIEKALEFKPDLIILDIMMPNVDGYATIESVKKNEKLANCKVIFLSAKNKESDIEKGMQLGADAYMTKPFSIKKLVDQVNELLKE